MGEQNSKTPYFSHGNTLLESEIRAPLIVKLPGNTFSNKRINSHVSLVDIFPTVVEFIGEKDLYSEGKNLLRLTDNQNANNSKNTNFVQIFDGKIIAVRKDNYKLIMETDYDILTLRRLYKQKENINFMYVLYDLKKDPLERNDIAKDNLDIVKKMYSEFFEWLVSSDAGQGKDYSSVEKTDEETLNHLKSLGYIN